MHDHLYDTLTKMINNAETEDEFQDVAEFMVKTLNITPEEQKHLNVLVSRDELARRKKFK
ncbi:hypothetical protein [Acetobacter peroxydans]|uniref:Uncharacterized protein n=1 Tax=Acetobacter peroxydans TaxID=104098 RepID=A0A4Y3TW37_9PROT|nr:hypothetical protein [Acetobacter peroxydans]NHO16198.1 hypothetical protein [Acetobacter peroxydans]GBR34213.1 hypothetical protein AA13755_0789 [Acetobacter peroxydans NBRC 13755]GBR40664.1 hypothetical protein AA0475_0735 [Acetobacter peroxydans]GEB85689.1 hypothetical protein APE01nite_14860 [Acetobacter peroxydans]